LSNLSALLDLQLQDNEIRDISPLADLPNLTSLAIGQNGVSDLSPLTDLTNLEELDLEGNRISDLSPLANLANLIFLDLASNEISDITALVENEGLGKGDIVDLAENPLSQEAIDKHIPELQARGVTVRLIKFRLVG